MEGAGEAESDVESAVGIRLKIVALWPLDAAKGSCNDMVLKIYESLIRLLFMVAVVPARWSGGG